MVALTIGLDDGYPDFMRFASHRVKFQKFRQMFCYDDRTMTELSSDERLLLAVDALCGDVHLCKISTIASLAGMDSAFLTAALLNSVARGHTVLVGDPTPNGFIWLTRAGAQEADRLLSRQVTEELSQGTTSQEVLIENSLV